MATYTLELELFSLLNASTSDFEIWADGSQLGGGYSITSSGSTISVSVPYGGALPSSLEFRFNDSAPGSFDQIEVRSVKINDRYVNTGNYLSNNILNDGGSSTVNVTGSDYIFDSSADPAASEFTTGATRAFTGGNDFYNGYNETTAEVFDMLGGRDYAHLGSGNDKVSGGAGDDTLRGEAGNDLLFGDADNDRIYGGDGDDTLHGGTGNDRIHGNAGNDEIHGGAGDDRLNGHADDDVITGGAGDDKLTGGSGNDSLFGDADDDKLMGGSGDDTLDGGDGNDLLYGGNGADQMDGGDGTDTLVGDAGNDIMHGGDGDDELRGGAGNDTIDGGAGNDTASYENSSSVITANLLTGIGSGEGSDTFTNIENLTGGSANDDLRGDAGVNILTGNDGSDDLYGGDGADILDGGAGTDYFVIEANEGLGDQYDGGTGTDYIYLSDDAYFDLAMTFTDVEYIDMDWNNIYAELNGGYDLTGLLTTNAWGMYGNTGNETITGSDSGDGIIGGEGADVLNGGGGNDDFYIGGTEGLGDVIDGGAGASNVVQLTALTYLNAATSFANLRAIDMNGYDIYAEVNGGYDLSAINELWAGGLLYGNTGNETIRGMEGENEIYGLAGDDTITGGSSQDELYGGDDNDTLNGGDNTDELYGEDGNDTLNGQDGYDRLYGGDGNDILNGGNDPDDLYGGAGVDTLNGDAGNDQFLGGAGADILNGGAGNDTFNITGTDAIGDVMNGGTGSNDVVMLADSYLSLATTFTNITAIDMDFFDLYAEVNGGYDLSGLITYSAGNMYGNTGNETITGSEYADYMDGLAGNDTINGGAGADEIYGGLGDDTLNGDDARDELYGGGGNDVLNGGDDDDELYGEGDDDILIGGTGDDTLDGGAGNDILYALDTTSGSLITTTATLFSEAFSANSGVLAYADGGFGGSDPANVDISGSHLAGDGNLALGAIDVWLDNDSGSPFSNGSGNWSTSYTSVTNVSNLQISFAYNHWHAAENDSGENSQVYFEFNGVQYDGSGGNSFISQGLGSAGETDTGWVTVTINLPDMLLGETYDLSWGLFHTGSNNADEDTWVGFDDITFSGDITTFVGVASDADSGAANIVGGGAGSDILYGSSGGDDLYGGSGDDTLYGGNGDDEIYGVSIADSSSSSASSGMVNSQHFNFDAGTSGAIYVDNPFGTSTGGGAYSSGSYTATEGAIGNGALEISLGGIDGSYIEFMAASWGGNFTKTSATSNIYVQYSYRIIHGEDFELWESVDQFYQLDGAAAVNVNRIDGDGNGGGDMDTGWITTILDLGVLSTGAHNFNIGGELNEKDGASEETQLFFDDMTWIEVEGSVETGTTNAIYGGDGEDVLYGSTETDVFIFESATAFNDIDQIVNFNATEADRIDIHDLLTGFSPTDNISEFLRFTDSGSDTLIQVDANGAVGGSTYVTVGQINDLTGLDEAALYANGNIIA